MRLIGVCAKAAVLTEAGAAMAASAVFMMLLRSIMVRVRHCEERSDEAIQFFLVVLDCFAEPVIGRRAAPTCWLAMTIN
jgi:hypothetical protein